MKEVRVRDNPNFKRYKDTPYYISVLGEVYKEFTHFDRKMKTYALKGKRYFSDKGKSTNLCRTMWELFKYPIPDGYFVVHINGNKKDNRLVNLKLVTGKQMASLGGKSQRKRPILNIDTGEVYRDKYACGKALGYTPDYIRKICHNRTHSPYLNLKYLHREEYEL